MHNLNWFDTMATGDMQKFEEGLINWAKSNNKNAIMLFDQASLHKIMEEVKKEGIIPNTPQATYRHVPCPTKLLRLQHITIEWYTVSYGKCILKSIKEANGLYLYEEPKNWKDATLWYAF